jgi:hypothetical protein
MCEYVLHAFTDMVYTIVTDYKEQLIILNDIH